MYYFSFHLRLLLGCLVFSLTIMSTSSCVVLGPAGRTDGRTDGRVLDYSAFEVSDLLGLFSFDLFDLVKIKLYLELKQFQTLSGNVEMLR